MIGVKAIATWAIKSFVKNKLQDLLRNQTLKLEEKPTMSTLDDLYRAYRQEIYNSQSSIDAYVQATKQHIKVQEPQNTQLSRLLDTLTDACVYILEIESLQFPKDTAPLPPDTTKPPEEQVAVEAKRLRALLEYFSRLIQLYQAASLNTAIRPQERREIAETIAEREWEVEGSISLLRHYNAQVTPEPAVSWTPTAGTPAYIGPIMAKLDEILTRLPGAGPAIPFEPPAEGNAVEWDNDTGWMDTLGMLDFAPASKPLPMERLLRWQRYLGYQCLIGDPNSITVAGDFEPKVDRTLGWITLANASKPMTDAVLTVTGLDPSGKRIVQKVTAPLASLLI